MKKFGKFACGLALLSLLYNSACSDTNIESQRKKEFHKNEDYKVSSKNSTPSQSYRIQEQEDYYADHIIEEENGKMEPSILERSVDEEIEKYEEERPSFKETTDRHFFGQGFVLDVRIFEEESQYKVDCDIRLLDEYKESINWRESGRLKLPYEENTKEGKISFNIPLCDLKTIKYIEAKSRGHKYFISELPLRNLWKYNPSSNYNFPDELKNRIKFKYLSNQSKNIIVSFKDKYDFFEKIEKKDYVGGDSKGSTRGLFQLIPIEIYMKKLPTDIRIE